MKKILFVFILLFTVLLLGSCDAENQTCKPHKLLPAVRENEITPTCGMDGGYDSVLYCATCKEELSRTRKIIPKTNEHTPLSAIKENQILPTCEKSGSHDEVVYCSVCYEELDKLTVTDAKIPHNVENGKCVNCNRKEDGGFTFSYYLNKTAKLISIGDCTDTEIIIPEETDNGFKIVYIGEAAFKDCKNITSVIIPDSVTLIDDEAFKGCAGLKEIVLPKELVAIGKEAFMDCTALTSINIPSSVDNIRDYAFFNCRSLESVVFGQSSKLKLINDSTFRGCESLRDITIPEGVEKMHDCAFMECRSLSKVHLPDSIEWIDSFAFADCISLYSITLPKDVRIADAAFPGCCKLVEVINNSSEDITVGFGVAASAIEVHTGKSKIVNKDGYIFYTAGGVNYLVGYAGDDTELTLPKDYNGEGYEIYKYAFYENDNVTKIIIPDSVSKIDEYAFSYCDSLVSVTIGNGVTHIGEGAFHDCYSLASITIPNSVKSIGYSVFSRCKSLTSVTIGKNVESIATYVFYDCGSLTNIKYRGTEKQWNAISKTSYWDYNTGSYTITYNYTGE